MTKINDLRTPALLLDKNKLIKNIDYIVTLAEKYRVNYRPHIKTHKSIDIVKMQLDKGAVGITVATVGEAEVMVEAGVKDILIAFPVSNLAQLDVIKKLQEKTKITLAVDSEAQVDILASHFQASQPLEVWIKVNAGLNRCGVEPREEVVELAKYIQKTSSLILTGIFTHAGQSYAASSLDQVKAIAQKETQVIRESALLCEEAGILIKHRSVGSTPTFQYYDDMTEITEIRPGNAVFFDMVQVGLGVVKVEQCALSVLASVATSKANRIVIDAGSKTLALDKGAHGNDSIQGHGRILEYPELVLEKLSEEHGVIPLEEKAAVAVGEKITIIPNHACPVANLFHTYHLIEDGEVVDQFEVSAQGRNR